MFSDPLGSPSTRLQSRLMRLAAAFVFLFSAALTLSPAVRLHTWNTRLIWGHWLGAAVWLVGFLIVYRQVIRFIPDVDPILLPVVALLTGWGLLTIWRLDMMMGLRQTIWLAVGLGLVSAGLRIPYVLPWLRRYKYAWLFAGLALTALTFFFGTYPGGAGPHLWLGCCGVYIQPSEPLKLLLVAYLAAYLADRLPVSFNLPSLIAPTLVMLAGALALLFIQRDLGAATLILVIYAAMLYLASGKRRFMLVSLAAVALAGFIGYRLFDVVRLRVDAWINPWADPSGRSYQIVQSMMAFAAGGIFGRGPGLGSPGVVPIAHSDFIFSAIAEENGLLGVSVVLLLYALLALRLFRAAIRAPTTYQRYLCAGITVALAGQAILILGGTLRLLPLTGVTLPFMSYGGSSLWVSLAAFVIVISGFRNVEDDPAPLQRVEPYLIGAGGVSLALVALALLAGWWAIIRQDSLLNRTDNPRRSIADRYVQRGAIYDRTDQPLAISVGKPGEYSRLYLYPALSTTIGYNSPLYGQGGLESGLDSLLRGTTGTPITELAWNRLAVGQPPPGLDIHLSIDLDLQKAADVALAGQKAALAMVNAHTGEILILASHPTYDANTLDTTWDALISSPDAPLLNRAVQGLYPPGAALAPFILSRAISRGPLPELPGGLDYRMDTKQLTCALQPDAPGDWGNVLSSGCPAPLALLSKRFTPKQLDELFLSLGFYSSTDIPLQVASASPSRVDSAERAALGQDTLTITPLQGALAAAAVSNEGVIPSPILVLSTRLPGKEWTSSSPLNSQVALDKDSTLRAADLLSVHGTFYWETLAVVPSGQNQTVVWYLAGTLKPWKGSPLALALVLETNDPLLSRSIGRSLMENALNTP